MPKYKATIVTSTGSEFFHFWEDSFRAASILTEAICEEMQMYGIEVNLYESSVEEI